MGSGIWSEVNLGRSTTHSAALQDLGGPEQRGSLSHHRIGACAEEGWRICPCSSSRHPSPPSSDTIILIPARLASTRLPDKPLAEIGGVPMIVQVWRRACAAEVGPVVVACAERAIADAVVAHGGDAVLTEPDLPSGTDRIRQALQRARSGAAGSSG